MSACSDGADSEPADSSAAGGRTAAPPPQEGAVVTVEAPAAIASGAPVPIKVRVRNTTAAPLDLYLRGREVTFDIAVTDSSGDAVWRRLEGEVVQAILQLKTLASNETLELAHTWDQRSRGGEPVPPGRYRIRANILTDGQTELKSNEASFTITAR